MRTQYYISIVYILFLYKPTYAWPCAKEVAAIHITQTPGDNPSYTAAKKILDGWYWQNRSHWPGELMEQGAMANKALNETANIAIVPAHGMNKKQPTVALEDLIAIFRDGIKTDNSAGGLHYAPLATKPGEATLSTTANGVAYRDGPFILVGKKDSDLSKTSDIAAILVNPSIAESIPHLQKLFPQVRVLSFLEASEAVKAAINPETKVDFVAEE